MPYRTYPCPTEHNVERFDLEIAPPFPGTPTRRLRSGGCTRCAEPHPGSADIHRGATWRRCAQDCGGCPDRAVSSGTFMCFSRTPTGISVNLIRPTVGLSSSYNLHLFFCSLDVFDLMKRPSASIPILALEKNIFFFAREYPEHLFVTMNQYLYRVLDFIFSFNN